MPAEVSKDEYGPVVRVGYSANMLLFTVGKQYTIITIHGLAEDDSVLDTKFVFMARQDLLNLEQACAMARKEMEDGEYKV